MELPSAIGMLDTMVGWTNDSHATVTGRVVARVTKPLGDIVSLTATDGQDVAVAPGGSQAVIFDMMIDQSGSWVLDAALYNKSNSALLDRLIVNFIVDGFFVDFEGAPQVCDAPPCSVTFTNLVTGGTLPYQDAIWDFGDGTAPAEGMALRYGETVVHNYTTPGFYDVTLEVVDAEEVSACYTEVDYIAVGEGINEHTWSFSTSGFFPKHLPDSYLGSVVLADLVGVPANVQGVYYNEFGTWKFWAPGAPGTTLTTLGGGHTYDYVVAVTGDCDWAIPLP
jgi:PKD repeat protein